MIDSRFGLKYSFPHSLVHIVDNSMYTGQLGVTETYDPSLLTTLVVTGMPMGVDNRITTVTRSDVLNKAFGAETLAVKDIQTYGQSVEYPSSLINQGVPVKLLRVAPPGATYAISVLYYDWRKQGNSIEARLRSADAEDLVTSGINLASYQNTDRLARAIFIRLKKDSLDNESVADENWHRLVLMAYISAGKGSAYNNFSVYINKPTTTQRKKFANAVYNFGTIDDRYTTPIEVERFTASLINDATKLSTYGAMSTMDTVNIQMKKRLEGSSIMIPYLNEEAVRFIYDKWHKLFESNRTSSDPEYMQREKVYKNVINDMNVNKFDIIFGKYLYTADGSDTEINIPYYNVDMEDSEIQKLSTSNIIAVDNFSVTKYEADTSVEYRNRYDLRHDMTVTDAETTNEATTQDDVMASIFINKIYPYWNDLYGRKQKINDTAVWTYNFLNTSWAKSAYATKKYDYAATDTAARETDYEALRYNTAVTPGILYLSNPDTDNPSISMIYSIGQYTGLTMSLNIPKLYHFYTKDNQVYFDKSSNGIARIKKVLYYPENVRDNALDPVVIKKLINNNITNANTFAEDSSSKNSNGSLKSYGSIIAVVYRDTITNTNAFKLYRISKLVTTGNITTVDTLLEYPGNYYAALVWESWYNKEQIHEYVALRSKVEEALNDATDNEGTLPTTPEYPKAFYKLGALYIDDVTVGTDANWAPMTIKKVDVEAGENTTEEHSIQIIPQKTVQLIAYFNTKDGKNPINGKGYPNDTLPVFYDVSAVNAYRVGNVPTNISITTDFTNQQYDYIYLGNEIVSGGYGRRNDDGDDAGGYGPNGQPIYGDASLINFIKVLGSKDEYVSRYQVTAFPMSTMKIVNTGVAVPSNYYVNEYGICPDSEHGGVKVVGGSYGFFDDYANGDISEIEFKLRYSELLVQAFRGEIDSRILSPARVPAKYLFDGGFNTVLGIKSLPFTNPDLEDIIFASTIFTQEEKEEYAIDSKLISSGIIVSDIDVKQAMYDLMIHRCYQGIPEDKRPIGPGSGLSLHLDSGFCDIEVIKKLNQSFKSRFTNPNASWDIGGYTSAVNGVTYTYVKRLVDHMFDHMQRYTVNKPFVNTYTAITPDEYLSFFPDIDTTDWDLEELMYTSGGNSWVLDESRSLKRKSQRTLYREETGTSDLLQENNMRTLSQLVYLLQNRIDRWLLEYVDDGVLTSMTESINNIFSGWVGTRVQALDIRFEQDINTDGGEIVICYVNVTFRGLLLRVPIIVNVNRREI